MDIINYQQNWLEYKWEFIDNPIEMPNYDIVIFDSKNTMATFNLDSRGLCLITVGIAKGEKMSNNYRPVVAMIDTGSTASFITEKLADTLGVDKNEKIEVKGHSDELSYYMTVNIISRELEMIAPISVLITSKESEGVDMFLGADFMSRILFSRDGKTKSFTLSYQPNL